MKLLPLLLLVCSVAARPEALQLPGGSAAEACKWHKYETDEHVSSWEFQMRSKHDTDRTRPEWQEIVEQAFEVAEHRFPAFKMDRSSRQSMMWRESAHRLTTDDAQPLDAAAKAHNASFPWRQVAVLRLRSCMAVEAPPGSAHTHLLEPGQADLTLKLKDVKDPATFPTYQKGFPAEVHGARLEVKLENDVHCKKNHVSYSAVFRRTEGVEIEQLDSLEGVHAYFPTLLHLMHLPRDFPLPLAFDHFQSKTYWDVQYGDMHGTVQLYLNSTSREAAVTGSQATMMEMSMRLARKDASKPRQLADALHLVGTLCELLGQHGWTAVVMPSADHSVPDSMPGAERSGWASAE